MVTTTVDGAPTTISSEISVTSSSAEQGDSGADGVPSAGSGAGGDSASVVPTVITQTLGGSAVTLTTSVPVATGEQSGEQAGSATSVLVTPTQSVVTVFVSGSAALSTSSTLLTSTVIVPANNGASGGVESSTLSVDAIGGNTGSPSTILVPTQSIVTVTVSGGQESLSTSSALATQTVFVTAGGNNAASGATQQATVTVTQTAGGIGGQCEASTVTVCATGGVCPTGSIDGTRFQSLPRVRV